MAEDPGPEGLYKGSRPGGWWKCGAARPNRSVGIAEGFEPGPFAASGRALCTSAAPMPRRSDAVNAAGLALCDLPLLLPGCQ